MSNSLLRIETLTGQPVKTNNIQLRLRSQVVQLQLPVAHGGLIWNRPVAVVIQTPNGQYQTLTIQDVTRATVLALMTVCLASTFLLILFRRKTA